MLDDIRYQRAGQLPREERFRTLLDGHSVMGSELLELGIPRERDSVLLVFDPPPGEPISTLSQVRSTVQRHLSLHHPEAVTTVRDRRVFALMEGNSESASLITDSLLAILDRLISPGTRVALPGFTRRATEIARLGELAGNLLEVAPRENDYPRMLTVEKLRPLLLIDRLGPFFEDNPELRAPSLDRLQREFPESAETLLAWCASFGNIALAARRLEVHENTIRYRLQRIKDLQGLDLDDPDTRLTVWLQLRAAR